MSTPGVGAATGIPLLRNRTQNILTRITDMEIYYSCSTMRAARSSVGAVLPPSGALSVYDYGIVRDNIADYTTSGTYSDDRRLGHYILGTGQTIVAVDTAIVETEMPSTCRKIFRQRTRWFKGALQAIPYEVENLPLVPLAFRAWNLIMFVVWPFMAIWQVLIAPAILGADPSASPIVYWMILLYIQTSAYMARPGIKKIEKILSWVFLTPFLMIFQLLLIRTSLYWATTQLRDGRWGTRIPEKNPTEALA
jgi:hyaluronan synthase